jgi:transposase
MPVRDTTKSRQTGGFKKPRALRTCDENSTIFMSRTNLPWPGKLGRIGGLYDIERDIRGWPRDERRRMRNERSRLLLKAPKQWLKETLAKLLAKSETAKAVRYALKLWNALMRYVDDGRLEIDNNAEPGLRAVVLV